VDDKNTIYVMSGRSHEELDRLFRRVPNIGLIAENGCFLKEPGSRAWAEIADAEQIGTWKESVKRIMEYYLDRAPGAEIEERRCSLIFHYKSAEDYESASRSASDCASHINDACEEQRVHATLLDGSVIVEPIDWTKGTAAEKIFDDLRNQNTPEEASRGPVDFLMVVGDGREDEKVFKWANSLGEESVVKEVVTVSLGSRSTEAGATLTQGVSGKLTYLVPTYAVSSLLTAAPRCFAGLAEAFRGLLIRDALPQHVHPSSHVIESERTVPTTSRFWHFRPSMSPSYFESFGKCM